MPGAVHQRPEEKQNIMFNEKVVLTTSKEKGKFLTVFSINVKKTWNLLVLYVASLSNNFSDRSSKRNDPTDIYKES